MTSQPFIVLLEDERAQLLAVRAALKGLGEIQEFGDPTAALGFLKQHAVDAAVIDIHMPRFQMNGLDFIRSVRGFDQDLCVIIRTGDDSAELADGAIEVRAFRRAIKGRISIDELRSLTLAAVNETRRRRQVTIDAASAADVKTQLARTLGSVEEELSTIDAYKALFQSTRNRLTAIAGMAEVICTASANDATPVLKESAPKNRQLVNGLLAEVGVFLDGPYAEDLRAARAPRRGTVNGVVEALRKRFMTAPKWIAEGKAITVSGLSQDMFVSAPPIKLITALRHLIEFCLARGELNSVVRLTAHYEEHADRIADRASNLQLVFNGNALRHSTPHIVFRLHAQMRETSLDDIQRAVREHPDDPREGNLQMISLALDNEQTAIIARHSDGVTLIDLFIPASR